jgi:hypothetical protein
LLWLRIQRTYTILITNRQNNNNRRGFAQTPQGWTPAVCASSSQEDKGFTQR